MEALVCSLSLSIALTCLEDNFDDDGNNDTTLVPKDAAANAKRGEIAAPAEQGESAATVKPSTPNP